MEDIRVRDVSTSQKTGRIVGRRKTHRHFREDPLEPRLEEPPPVEEVDASADPEPSESPPVKATGKRKRKRVRAIKENDSVSFVPIYQFLR